MKSTSILLLTLFLLPLSSVAQLDSIDVFVWKQMKEQQIAGLSLGIIQNGKIIMAKGYGLANLELKVSASANTARTSCPPSSSYIRRVLSWVK